MAILTHTRLNPTSLVFHGDKGRVLKREDDGPGIMSVHISPVSFEYCLRSLSRSALAVDSTGDRLAVCCGKDFELWSLSTLKQIRTIQDPRPPTVLFPKQVAFTDDDSSIVTGTDHGCAVIYDCESGDVLQTLVYPTGTLVQTVAVRAKPFQRSVALLTEAVFSIQSRTVGNCEVIAVAGSAMSGPSAVMIWKKIRRPPPSPQAVLEGHYTIRIPEKIVKVFLLVLALTIGALAIYVSRPFDDLDMSEVRLLYHPEGNTPDNGVVWTNGPRYPGGYGASRRKIYATTLCL